MIIRASIAGGALLMLTAIAMFLSSTATTMAQEPTPAAAPSVQAESCDVAYLHYLDARVSWPNSDQPRTVTLEWWDELRYYLEEPYDASYRIERRNAESNGSADWETLETVTNTNSWKGPVELGTWIYRVAIVSVEVDDVSWECRPQWAEVSVNVLTEEELIEAELELFCNHAYIWELYATVADSTNWPDETLTLEWHDELMYFVMYHGGSDDRFYVELEAIHYRIEKTAAPADDNAVWQTVAEVLDEGTWTGSAEPGKWVYRVGVVKIEGNGVTRECKPLWAETKVTILTEEERAEQERQREVLIAESVRCATNELTDNLNRSAMEAVGAYVEERIDEIVGGFDSYGDSATHFRQLVVLTVLLCSDEGPGSYYGYGGSWAMVLLLDDYYYY